METIINKMVNDNPDSLEVGTPAKGGSIKIYCNFDNDYELIKGKIDRALKLRNYAKEEMGL